MQWLVRWSIKNRRQAAIAIAACCLIPLLFWLGSAIAALIMLRQNSRDGLKVVMWGSLPAIGWWSAGDPTVAINLLLGVLAGLALRSFRRLDLVLCGLGLAGIALFNVVHLFYGEAFPLMVEAGKTLVTQSFTDQQQADDLMALIEPLMKGGLAAMHILLAIICLILGRYWQSQLDHPGGFGQEFRQLRLPLLYAAPISVLAISSGVVQPQIACLLLAATMPLTIAGLAVIHGAVAKTGAGTQWLVLTYMSCFFVGTYMYVLLIFIAALDSVIDIRARLKDTA